MPHLTFWRRRAQAVTPPAPEAQRTARDGRDIRQIRQIRQIRESALGVIGAPLPQAAPGVIAEDTKLACDAPVGDPYPTC
ncbi:hypothetical protein P3T23_009801 [Paraburkholderia sp. GAS448]|jgi:hypothetical protein|uniref:hypothetical protein n=1 Tax=Paraburkholderia sp. GAS448 TaxID=3035136 RepID=UPI003D223CAA